MVRKLFSSYRGAIFFVVVTSLIGAMQAFTQFYIMTQGGPAYATTPLVLYIFRNAFEFYKMGYAATVATALFGIILVVALNAIQIGVYKLVFWFAQQGSIYTFVVLIFFYAWRMGQLDRQFNVHED